MKKLILLFVCLAAFTAQRSTAQRKPVEVGVRAGYNLNTFWDNDYDTRVLSGFTAGLFTDIYLVRNLYIQPGLSYSRKGTRERDFGFTNSYKLDYLEMPVYVGYVFEFSKVAI
ncbi:MAG: PorT family protein, partial [Alistipes sp.]|nr:PorT family protein [Alistipes sp.]